MTVGVAILSLLLAELLVGALGALVAGVILVAPARLEAESTPTRREVPASAVLWFRANRAAYRERRQFLRLAFMPPLAAGVLVRLSWGRRSNRSRALVQRDARGLVTAMLIANRRVSAWRLEDVAAWPPGHRSATALLSAVADQADAEGVDLRLRPAHASLVDFYVRLGYERCGRDLVRGHALRTPDAAALG